MTTPYRLFGAEMSPYSVKVRAYLRYQNIPHQWLVRNEYNQAEYDQHAKIPILPLLVDPQGDSQQDSTPIIEKLEESHSRNSIYPSDPALKFLSQLIEEFSDEWGNKWMFHYRWAREVDRQACSKRLALMMKPSADETEQNGIADFIKQRMLGRTEFVGSNKQTAPLIESSFLEAIEQLDQHLASRPYLLGGKPSFADFGLWAQLYCCWTDPTAGSLIEARAQNVLAWIHRMLYPLDLGKFETWPDLAPSLSPFLQSQIGQRFIPWTLANERAINAGEAELELKLLGQSWRQQPQKYHVKSLQQLRIKYQALSATASIDAMLQDINCEAEVWI